MTNNKLHTGFRLVATLATLNDLERVIALILRYFTEFDNFARQLCHNGWRLTYNVRNISCSSYIWPKLTLATVAQQLHCLFVTAKLLVYIQVVISLKQKLTNHNNSRAPALEVIRVRNSMKLYPFCFGAVIH